MNLMKKILEMRLDKSYAETPSLQGRIHSKFSRALNLEFIHNHFQPRLITLLSSGSHGVPDSLIVDSKCFEEISILSVGTAVEKKDLIFSFDGMKDSIAGGKDDFKSDILPYLQYRAEDKILLRNADIIHAFIGKRNEQDGFFRLPLSSFLKIEQELLGLCHALKEGNAREIEEKILLCSGVGCGLTPSSDDAVVGILAAAKSGIFGVDLPSISMIKLWEKLHRLTTDISRKYLCCAVEGRFSDVLRALIKAITKSEEVQLESSLQNVANIGSTSGMDMLKGVALAFRAAAFGNGRVSLKGDTYEAV